jgi:hypothetical protein
LRTQVEVGPHPAKPARLEHAVGLFEQFVRVQDVLPHGVGQYPVEEVRLEWVVGGHVGTGEVNPLACKVLPGPVLSNIHSVGVRGQVLCCVPDLVPVAAADLKRALAR